MSDKDKNIVNFNGKKSINQRRVEEILKMQAKFKSSTNPYMDKNFVVIVHDKTTGYTNASVSSNDSVLGLINTLVEVFSFDHSKVDEWALEAAMVEAYYAGTFFERYTVEFVNKFEPDDESFYDYYDTLVKSKGTIK